MSSANYRRPGEVADYIPSSAVAVGAVVRLGLMQCGIALAAIAANASGAVAVEGVFEKAKDGTAFAQGDHVWWDPTAAQCIGAPVTGSLFLGYAFDAAATSATTLMVSLEEFDAEPARLLSLAATGNQALAVADFLSGNLTILAPNTGALSLALPAIAEVPIGARFTLRKTHATAQAITIDPNASETIAGGASFATIDANGDWATFQSDGAAWQLVSSVIA